MDKEINSKNTAIKALLKLKFSDIKELTRAKRQVAKEFGIGILDNAEILGGINEHGIKVSADKLRLLKKRAVRTMSGIAPVAVLTRDYPCPGRCAYCPAEKDVPQSYLSNEPAVMRAIRCNYDPYVQVQDRLRALVNNGHDPGKIELIIIGGTWSALPGKYRFRFVKECFRGANDFRGPRTADRGSLPAGFDSIRSELKKEQKKNEGARYRIVGITVETRPDYINEKELWHMRELGVTRVELGVQAIDDAILEKNRRGHGVREIALATKRLKDLGFKVTYHIMPGLPGSNVDKDLKMFKQLFGDERFQPDQIKFYPTVVTRGSLLYRWWKAGKYKPYTARQLENLIIKCKEAVPGYVRIIRLIRDIPGESIVAGNMVTNLRQVMKDKGAQCGCIRCREARTEKLETGNWKLEITEYSASQGMEYFISAASRDNRILYGFCRLRLSSGPPPKTRSTDKGPVAGAMVRELHVYGELVPANAGPLTGPGRKRKVQHSGLGARLLGEAERIAREAGREKIAVISGAGVRGYYRKHGYRLKDTYMVKRLTPDG